MENGLIDYSDKRIIDTLKKTVAIGATDEEFMMFCEHCKSSGLNPFKKEVWFVKASGRVQIMTGINGFLAIANRNPNFDGMEVDVEVDAAGKPIKATAKVYRKDRRFPSVGIALMSEYKKGTPIWSQMPSVMLTKVAKSIALREAFPQEMNGLYTDDEMPKEYSAPIDVTPKLPVMLEEQKETWYYLPNATETMVNKLKKAGCLEYWKEELDTKTGCFDELYGFWKSPVDLGEKLEKAKIAPPSDVMEVGE